MFMEEPDVTGGDKLHAVAKAIQECTHLAPPDPQKVQEFLGYLRGLAKEFDIPLSMTAMKYACYEWQQIEMVAAFETLQGVLVQAAALGAPKA